VLPPPSDLFSRRIAGWSTLPAMTGHPASRDAQASCAGTTPSTDRRRRGSETSMNRSRPPADSTDGPRRHHRDRNSDALGEFRPSATTSPPFRQTPLYPAARSPTERRARGHLHPSLRAGNAPKRIRFVGDGSWVTAACAATLIPQQCDRQVPRRLDRSSCRERTAIQSVRFPAWRKGTTAGPPRRRRRA
jgi:hypothetical protein